MLSSVNVNMPNYVEKRRRKNLRVYMENTEESIRDLYTQRKVEHN